MYASSPCLSGEILNPLTNKCVLLDSEAGTILRNIPYLCDIHKRREVKVDRFVAQQIADQLEIFDINSNKNLRMINKSFSKISNRDAVYYIIASDIPAIYENYLESKDRMFFLTRSMIITNHNQIHYNLTPITEQCRNDFREHPRLTDVKRLLNIFVNYLNSGEVYLFYDIPEWGKQIGSSFQLEMFLLSKHTIQFGDPIKSLFFRSKVHMKHMDGETLCIIGQICIFLLQYTKFNIGFKRINQCMMQLKNYPVNEPLGQEIKIIYNELVKITDE